MSKENDILINILKSPEATEKEIYNAFEDYFKHHFHFVFLKPHVQIIKKLKREYIYQFLFRKGFLYSIKIEKSTSNYYALYSPISFYKNPFSLMNSLSKIKNNSIELKEIFSTYEKIIQIIDPDSSFKLTLSCLENLNIHHPLIQKFIILNCFRFNVDIETTRYIFGNIEKYNFIDFIISLYKYSLHVGQIWENGELINQSFFYSKHLNLKFLIHYLYSKNKLHYINFYDLYSYLDLETIKTYFKETILNNQYDHLNAHRFNSFFEKKILNIEPFKNFDEFMVTIFEISKPTFINSIFQKGETLSYSYNLTFTPAQHFETFKYKFKLFCESDFNPKIISQSSFFLNDKFKSKDKITHSQMKELIYFIFKNQRTLEKFKQNLKHLNNDFRAFFIIDDF